MKEKIAVVMGGYSSEYEISLQSGDFIFQELDQREFAVYKVHIFKEEWYVLGENEEKHPIDKGDFSTVIRGGKIEFDCVFNMIHGAPGENGLLQGYLEILGIPQTASDFYASALTFNKRDCNSVLLGYGIKTAKNILIQRGDSIDEAVIAEKIGLPCFVKANCGGSSFGISKVKVKSELRAAIDHSFEEDDEVLIESFLEGREVDVSVIDYKDELLVLPVTEIISENEFFDYGAKYLGESQEITPARISEEDTKKVQDMAQKIYKLLRLKGFARAEFIFHNGEPYFLEINTCPGMTPASIVPQQLKAANITGRDFFTALVKETIRRSR